MIADREEFVEKALNDRYTSFGLADWDRDGHRDIVTREDATGNLWLYPGESKRGPGSVQRVQIGGGW